MTRLTRPELARRGGAVVVALAMFVAGAQRLAADMARGPHNETAAATHEHVPDYAVRWGFFALLEFRERSNPGDGVRMMMRELAWPREVAEALRDYIADAFVQARAESAAQTRQLCRRRASIGTRAQLGSALVDHDQAVQRTRQSLAQGLAGVLDPEREKQLVDWIDAELRPSSVITGADYPVLVASGALDAGQWMDALCGDAKTDEGSQR